MHHEAGDLSWPAAMIDECDMDIDLDIAAEVNLVRFYYLSHCCSIAWDRLGNHIHLSVCLYALLRPQF